jgi:dihydrofolate reductase
MRKLVVCTNVTLDGVMQGPARADEDQRVGFTRGGWGAPYGAMAEVGHVFGSADALLFGRRTFEDFYNVWPKRPDSPFTPWLTNIRKYVASRTLREPLPWLNSVLLKGDTAQAVSSLKDEPGKDILIMGSGELIQALRGANLIDEYVLLIHPLILGSGRRLFPEGTPFSSLRLVESMATAKGVVIATYQPASPPANEA